MQKQNKFFEGKDYEKGDFKPLTSKFYTPAYQRYIKEEELLVCTKVMGAKRVLEAGVGTGRMLRRLSPIVRQVVGVDNSQLMLEESRRVASRFRNVKIIEGNIEELGSMFPVNHFDFVLCLWNTLGNLDDNARALVEMTKVASKEILVSVHLKGALAERRKWYSAVGVEIKKIDRSTETVYTKDELVSKAYSVNDIKSLAMETGLMLTDLRVLGDVVLFAQFSKD